MAISIIAIIILIIWFSVHRVVHRRSIDEMLLVACAKNELPIAMRYILKGANINYVGKDSVTPLIIAAFYGNNNIVELLCNKNNHNDRSFMEGTYVLSQCYKQLSLFPVNVNYQNRYGSTALMEAMCRNNYTVIKSLICSGSNPYLKDMRGLTAFDYGDSHSKEILERYGYASEKCT